MKLRTKNWVEINDEPRTCNTYSQIKFKTTTSKSSQCRHSDTYILAKGTITVTLKQQQTPIIEKKEIVKNCAPITDCIGKINNTQLGNDKDIDLVMAMYNLIEYGDNYSEKWKIWKFIAIL